jgi:hypothetical protein
MIKEILDGKNSVEMRLKYPILTARGIGVQLKSDVGGAILTTAGTFG